MCTPGDDQILIAGTSVGSLVLFDLQDFESATVQQNLFDYESLLMVQNPADQDENGDFNP
jgi:patatin-like phospholipase/acyl hydrolase